MQSTTRFAILIIITVLLGSCGGSDETVREESLQVASSKRTCQTLVEQLCFLTRSSSDQNWTFLYENLEGLAYEWGREYTLQVRITERPGPGPAAADAPTVTRTYRVIAVTSSSIVPNTTTFSLNVRSPTSSLSVDAGGAWSLLGVRLACTTEVCQALQAAKAGFSPVLLRLDHRNLPTGPLHVTSVEPPAQ
jgi:Domain of unknown function (DUF4377)